MYDNIIYYGKTLKEWVSALNNQYTAGELYRMMQEGASFMDITRQKMEGAL